MKFKNTGFSIVEIVVATAIIGVSVVGIVAALNSFLYLSISNTNKAQAALLLEESLEVTQYIRDKSWTGNIAILNPGTEYYILWNDIDYSITDVPQSEKFTRILRFEKVDRDSSDNITASGDEDPGTRKVFVDISWNESGETKNINSEYLIHDVYQN